MPKFNPTIQEAEAEAEEGSSVNLRAYWTTQQVQGQSGKPCLQNKTPVLHKCNTLLYVGKENQNFH